MVKIPEWAKENLGMGVFIVVVLAVIAIIISLPRNDSSISSIILAVGIVVFSTIIFKSWKDPGFAQKLDHGQVRKAIAISFTVVYIIMLAFYFGGAYSQLINLNLTAQNNSMQVINTTSGETPISAVTNIYNNFLYIYVIIIGFYFGSRALEGFSEAKKTKAELEADPVKVAKTRFANGELSEEAFGKIMNKPELAEDPVNIAQIRYAKGELSKADYDIFIKDTEKK
jgi:hypothetical protein